MKFLKGKKYFYRWNKYAHSELHLSRKQVKVIEAQKNLKQALEMEKVISYFSNSLGNMLSVDDILWDVSKNCISQLGFVDCVIYLIDDEKKSLLQKAAWGPKTTHENKILNPLEIPLGVGIVGNVAVTGKTELIADTSKDSRYIVDDANRYSEITVPIQTAGRILGVLDSEHPQRNFYTSNHKQILETIAAICANKIIMVQAEAKRQMAIVELLLQQKQSAEAKLRSMRLQMNPHFLFNSLNAIQQLILMSHTDEAAKYLSRFSKLLRLVLLYSDYNTVTVAKEIELLDLYLQLESLRFKDSFHAHISCSSMLDKEEIEIPTLLIQPIVENAIWHGLLHKKGDRILQIQFHLSNEEQIICTIEDNGIGRKAAREMHHSVPDDFHTGSGIYSTMERLRIFNEQFAAKSFLVIEDLSDEIGNAAGTKVSIYFPLINE